LNGGGAFGQDHCFLCSESLILAQDKRWRGA
jgi:hypothetical protein